MEDFQQQKQSISLQMDEWSLFVCQGWIKGDYALFIPRLSFLAKRLVEKAHCEIIQEGVGLTMTKIR